LLLGLFNHGRVADFGTLLPPLAKRSLSVIRKLHPKGEECNPIVAVDVLICGVTGLATADVVQEWYAQPPVPMSSLGKHVFDTVVKPLKQAKCIPLSHFGEQRSALKNSTNDKRSAGVEET
jgi:hypothetical protein